MNRLTYILLFICSLSFGQGGAMVTGGIFNQMVHIQDFDQVFNGKWEGADSRTLLNAGLVGVGIIINENYPDWHISGGLDVRNALIGGTVNGRGLDGIVRVYYKPKNFSYGIMYENFDRVEYNAVSFYSSYSYKFLSAGVEINSIYNQNKQVLGPGANLELSTKEVKGFSVSLLGNFKYRTELKRHVNSVFLNVNKLL